MKIITLKISEDEAKALLTSLEISKEVAPHVMKKAKADKRAIKAFSSVTEFLQMKIKAGISA